MTTYYTRKVCEAELSGNEGHGSGKGWHYYYSSQVDTDIDTNQQCPAHPSSVMRDFVITSVEVTP